MNYKSKKLNTILKLFIISIVLILLYLTYMYTTHKTTSSIDANMNEVPYISTYYIKPIVSTKENIIIDFYITDYNHKSYVEEDTSDKFTVTVKIDGKKDIVKKNIKAGDNSINIGKFKELGEQNFSIIATDQHGRNSHELFNFFLVRDEVITNEYTMTEQDLVKYNIDNEDNKDNANITLKGIQQLLDDKKNEGYNKLTLLSGTYRIDHTAPIYIPTEFTLDLNQATIKLNGFTGDKALMIDLNNTFDSHVVNGTIEGDFYEHDYTNSPNNSEWVNGIRIGGESKYSSFENLTVKDITGYGGNNGIANSRDGSLGYTYYNPIPIGDTFKLGDIDRTTGLPIESKSRTTSDFVDIGENAEIGYLSVNRYLGYQGNPCSTWNLICHFYDENKEYLQSTDAYQYRRVGVPENAKYMKVTVLAEDYPTDLSVQYFRVPTHCAFKNVEFENCRAVGLAQEAMKDMLVEDCKFTKSGQTSAKCAYDAEDGWDMMQDVTFRGLNFYDNPNNDFLTCAGHNFIIEDMKDGKLYFWERTNSYVVRNSSNLKSSTIKNSTRITTGYLRFHDNIVNSNINISNNENTTWPIVVKDTQINGRAESNSNLSKYIRCDIGKSITESNTYDTALGTGEFIDSYIHDKSGENQGGTYVNCKLENISGNMHGEFNILDSDISNLNCNAGSYEPKYSFKDSNLNNVQINFPYWHQGATTLFENCDINNDGSLLMLPHYSMKKPISIVNNNILSNSDEGLINFYDDRTGGSAGELVEQSILRLENNKLDIPNSEYIVNGLTDKTVNNINIIDNNNTYTPYDIQLCNPSSSTSINISINNK